MLSKEEKNNLDAYVRDWEAFLLYYDSLIEERLKELDPKFVKSLRRHRKKNAIDFWYA